MKIDPVSQDVILELSGLALIKVSGADTITFLNNQFTNDINKLGENDWQFNGYCTAKGRLIAVMRLFTVKDVIYLIMPKSITEILLRRLQIYVFRAKVSFELLDCHAYAYLGTASQPVADHKPDIKQFKQIDGGFILNISEQQQRYLQFCHKPIKQVNGLIDGNCADIHWRLSEINESIPTVFADSLEKFIPQHVNLDQIGGVSFKKGCFPGQEVVARLHYLGKSKQSMRKMNLISDNKLNPGDSQPHPQTQKALTIVDAVLINDHSYSCLAVGQFE